MERLGSQLAYLYLLRVPLAVWLILLVVPWMAVLPHGALNPLLRGAFDIAGVNDLASLLAFFLVTLASLLAAASVGVTARLILLDGEERFGAARVPRTAGVRLTMRVLPLLTSVSIVVALCYEASASGAAIAWWAQAGGIGLGLGLFVIVMVPVHNWLWDQVIALERARDFGSSNTILKAITAITVVALAAARWLFAKSPAGYWDPKTDDLRDRHKFALIQLVLSMIFYVALFSLKGAARPGETPPVIPTLCLLLVLVMLLCWALTSLTFFFDRFRIPVLLVVVLYGTLVSGLPRSDHFHAAAPQQPPIRFADSAGGTLLERRAGKPAVLVAAAGGGIQSSAWTARVLSGLKQDLQTSYPDFDQSILVISSVSGGSVGAMYVADAYVPDASGRQGRLPDVPAGALDAYGPVVRAESSSLDGATWGLVYPDLLWTLFPFLKGIGLWPPTLLSGQSLTYDRGTSLENAWRLTPSLEKSTLAEWQRDAVKGARPAVIFNATLVETGQRLLLSTTAMAPIAAAGNIDHVGREEFFSLYEGFDVPVVTAARLSATFPVVSPAARIWRGNIFAKDRHVVDGGYYDNYGIATLVEWLAGALEQAARRPSKIVIVQIRGFEAGLVDPPQRDQGWFFQLFHPLETLAAVRGASQFSRNELLMDLVGRKAAFGVPVETVEFEYRGRPPDGGDERARPASPPLSWHLTRKDKDALRDEWNSPAIQKQRCAFARMLTRAGQGC